ncbi:kynureninase 2 [Trichocladium antarcticum]|uniref:Kynureninase n=1 Tax=Trichocladium antarcticum TaxID=1450529 RepID=A0AAN6ZB83_9PEZI|nr:kynureninase 2 [Trichocladium antarcticum]
MASEYQSLIKAFRAGQKPDFPAHSKSVEYARQLDAEDTISSLRDDFIIPTKGSIKKKALDGKLLGEPLANGNCNGTGDEPTIYFVGNSLGAQPKCIRKHLEALLETWGAIGVNGHFSSLGNSPLTAWQDMAADCAQKSVDIVGAASVSEVIYMNTLTANLHLLMASFYRPTATRHKIIAEWKPFPSDSYALASQIQWHGFSPATSLVPIHPDQPSASNPDGNMYISTSHILAVIDEHAESTALLLLPGIQYYTGQLFDMARITAHARARGIVVGWDLAHAAGNVELALHDWDVDFAVWCTYKYMNAGPGSIAGAFVHQRHHHHHHHHGNGDAAAGEGFRHRLAGWYGADKAVRFEMAGWEGFRPAEGAHGYQLSNPSAVDLASLTGALSMFGRTDMAGLRDKSLVLTGWLEWLLRGLLEEGVGKGEGGEDAFGIITPGHPLERGAQLSLLLRPGLLGAVSAALAERGVMFDVRKPDVIRVAPVPMYCRFEDVWGFVAAFRGVLEKA